MIEERRLSIELECARLVARYCHLVDHGEASKIADLFTVDGVWTAPGVEMNGRAQLSAGFSAREQNTSRKSKHVCNNLLVDVIDEDHAEGTVYLTLYRHDSNDTQAIAPLEGPVLVGEYRDRFVRTDAGWRFQRRETSIDFMKPGDQL